MTNKTVTDAITAREAKLPGRVDAAKAKAKAEKKADKEAKTE